MFIFVFVFKQKTAYELRISDWSSDVCSSDLAAAEDDVVVIKKYANRRLYDTERSCYITLEDLGAMVREGRDFSVIDAKSGEDITHNVLTQIIMDTETRGETMLPVNFLRHLLGLYGDKMQGLVQIGRAHG